MRNKQYGVHAMTVAEMIGVFFPPHVPIHFVAFDGSSYGDAHAELVIEIKRPRALYYIANHPGELGLARAYLQGDLDSPSLCPGDPYPILKALEHMRSLITKPNPLKVAKVLAALASHGIRRPAPPAIEGPSRWGRIRHGLLPHTKAGDAATVSYHYDQSNEFYAMFLGKSMTYTCALFHDPSDSLEQAQEAKLNLVLDKLDLHPGDHLLDIGCGWGSMAIRAAKRGIHVIGVTLSEEQVEWGNEWIKREGLSDMAELRLQDYRDIPEEDFDGICSLGMMEHVGIKHYPHYFEEIYKKLKPGARLLNHQITRVNSYTGNSADSFIDRYIFPDGELASPGEIELNIHDTGFEIIHEENLRQHYALTLHHWNKNLADHWNEATALVGEPKARLWGLYMAGSALNFELNTIQIHQFLCIKPQENGTVTYPLRPWWKN